MNGIKSRTKIVDSFSPYALRECASHKGKYEVYDLSVGINAIVARGLSFDDARQKCFAHNARKDASRNDIEVGDIYPCDVIMIGNDWKATNHITGETSASGYQTYKEALAHAQLLFSRWINTNKCVTPTVA